MDDVLAITQNVAKFAYRDQGRWDELRDLFHPTASGVSQAGQESMKRIGLILSGLRLCIPFYTAWPGSIVIPALTVTLQPAWCAEATLWRSRSSKPGQQRKRSYGGTQECGLPQVIEFLD